MMGDPGPVSVDVLHAARAGILAATAASTTTDAYAGARTVLQDLPPAALVDVAAMLATLLGNPAVMWLTEDEWQEVAARLSGPT